MANHQSYCWCYNCKRSIHYMGIASHRRGHRNRKELVRIQMSSGIYTYDYTKEGTDGD